MGRGAKPPDDSATLPDGWVENPDHTWTWTGACKECGETITKTVNRRQHISAYCAVCKKARRAAYRRLYYMDNRDTFLEYGKAHYAANREKIKAHYAANREKMLEKSKAYREANRDAIRKHQRETRAARLGIKLPDASTLGKWVENPDRTLTWTGTCKKCGETITKTVDQRQAILMYCAGCKRARMAAYQRSRYMANKETILEWRRANAETIKKWSKAYYAANKEKILEKAKAYREANRDAIRARWKANYDANREEILENKRKERAAKRASSASE